MFDQYFNSAGAKYARGVPEFNPAREFKEAVK
jgi:hypothetical protein